MNGTGRVCAALTLALLTACSSAESPRTLDDEDLEDKIQKILNDAKIPVVSVSCPSGQEPRKGESFDCSAEDADGRPVTMTVTPTDDRGNLFVQTTTIYAPHVEQAIEGANLTDAECPDGVPLIDAEGEIECTAVTARGRRVTVVVTVNAGLITKIIEKTPVAPGVPPECSDLWSGGADPECDECAARNCCDELTACASGSPCAEYSLCVNSCSGDAGCLETSCGHLTEGKTAAEAVLQCMTACPSSC